MSVWYDIPAQAPPTHPFGIHFARLTQLHRSQTISWFSWLGCFVDKAAGVEVLWLCSLLNLRRSARLDPAKLVGMTLFRWDQPGWRTGWWADEWATWKDTVLTRPSCRLGIYWTGFEPATSARSKWWEPRVMILQFLLWRCLHSDTACSLPFPPTCLCRRLWPLM